MGGPGLLAVLGRCGALPKVDLPQNKKVLVDVEAFHTLLVRASYNNSDTFDAVRFIKNTLQKKFAGLDVEYFFDGDGNSEKFRTSMERRTESKLEGAEVLIRKMEERAATGNGIKKREYKTVQKILRSSTVLTYDFKAAIVNALRSDGEVVCFEGGEADLAIRRRSWELLDNWVEFVVVGNDCDYAVHPTTTILLRPWGKNKFIEYNINTLLSNAGLSRAQYQALGVISCTDYSRNLPGLGIISNRRIIKAVSNGTCDSFQVFFKTLVVLVGLRHILTLLFSALLSLYLESDGVLQILNCYQKHPEVTATRSRYELLNEAERPRQVVDFSASRRIYVNGQESPLTVVQRDIKRLQEHQLQHRVQLLKGRMKEASYTRRRVIKERKRMGRQTEASSSR